MTSRPASVSEDGISAAEATEVGSGDSAATRRRSSGRRGSFRRWALGRVLQAILVVLGVTLATSLLIHLVPGDPALTILGVHATPASLAALRAQLHLGQPFLEQLWLFFRGAAHGNLGVSLVQVGQPVSRLVLSSLSVTLFLTAVSVVMATVAGTLLGLAAALTHRALTDGIIRTLVIALLATPSFLVGYVLLLLVAVKSGLAPAGGWGSGIGSAFSHIWLPALALAGYLTPVIARAVRHSARQALGQSFVEAAIARGISPVAIAWRHVLPNSLLPVITLVGLNVGGLVGGAAVLETVFNLPGIGTTLVIAVNGRDYPVVQGVAFVTAIMVVVVTLITDVLAFALDPRARYSG